MEAIWALILLNGIYWAAVLFLISLGLNIILGVGGILNLTHGQLYAFGAYMAAWTIIAVANLVPPPVIFLTLLAGLVMAAFVGLITEVLFIRPMYKRALEYQLLMTYGLLLAFEDVIKLIWGGEAYYAPQPMDLLGQTYILGYPYPTYFLFVIAASMAAGGVVWYIMFKTRTGVMLRAVAMDREMSSAIGLSVKKLSTIAFVFGAALAGLGGALIAPTIPVLLGIGLEPLLLAFMVIVIGGLGSLKGALIGSLIIGIVRSVGIAIIPEIELAVTFLIAAVILAVRPEGLFGGRKR